MPDKTYKLVEIVGVSEDSVQQAVRNGLKKASQTLRNIDWFEVTAIRGWVRDNQEPVFQVQMKVGFRLLERDVLHGSDEPQPASIATPRAPTAKGKAGKRKGKKK